ncbi:hypothetical protein [Streptomyces sp. NBC_00439]|uniref:hypothetical protein n=1 Tax=Streptomyces sp. NBC_00439 TaxID=2903650 RepID=UPI0022573C67|nr:hypothetical protein [Streptomyces sp. NBC_00439]MCX5098185.1 hypothetical protein [Streptomyces sp. NBC_00439]
MAPFTDQVALVTGAGSVPARPLTARRRRGAPRFGEDLLCDLASPRGGFRVARQGQALPDDDNGRGQLATGSQSR